jgi:amino acid transporter
MFCFWEEPMSITFTKSKLYASACFSVCCSAGFATLFCLRLKYIEHIDLSFWLVVALLFLVTLSFFIFVYISYPLLKKVALWEKKNKNRKRSRENMPIKSRFYTSACLSVCWSAAFTALACLELKYVEHTDLSFWLVAAFLFFCNFVLF